MTRLEADLIEKIMLDAEQQIAEAGSEFEKIGAKMSAYKHIKEVLWAGKEVGEDDVN